jgi:hypothetical protein
MLFPAEKNFYENDLSKLNILYEEAILQEEKDYIKKRRDRVEYILSKERKHGETLSDDELLVIKETKIWYKKQEKIHGERNITERNYTKYPQDYILNLKRELDTADEDFCNYRDLTENKILRLQREKERLGLFGGKRKKDIEKEIERLKEKINAKKLELKIDELNKRYLDIAEKCENE